MPPRTSPTHKRGVLCLVQSKPRGEGLARQEKALRWGIPLPYPPNQRTTKGRGKLRGGSEVAKKLVSARSGPILEGKLGTRTGRDGPHLGTWMGLKRRKTKHIANLDGTPSDPGATWTGPDRIQARVWMAAPRNSKRRLGPVERGKHTIKLLPKDGFGPPPPNYGTFSPPRLFTPCHFLRGNGHRPDQSHFLSSPKLVLEGALNGTFSSPPQNRTIRLPLHLPFPNPRYAGVGEQQ